MAKKDIELHDDPFFEERNLTEPEWIIKVIYGDSEYVPRLWLKRTKSKDKRVEVFNYEDVSVVYIARQIKKEQIAGLIRFLLYEYLEIRSKTNVCRIALGIKEQTHTEDEHNCEYRYTDYDLSDSIKTLRRGCLEGLLPSDFLNEDVNEWLENVDAKEG